MHSGLKGLQEFLNALYRAEADDAVGAVVVTGRGKAFCAGFNLKEIPVKDLDSKKSLRTSVCWRCGGTRSCIFSRACPSRSLLRSMVLRRAPGSG